MRQPHACMSLSYRHAMPFLNRQCPFWIFNAPFWIFNALLNLQCPSELSLPFLNLQCPFWIFNTPYVSSMHPSASSMFPFEASSNDAFIRQFNISSFEHPSPHTGLSIQFNRIIFQSFGSDLLFVCSRHCERERWNLANRWQQVAQLCRLVATDLESSVCSTDCHCCLC